VDGRQEFDAFWMTVLPLMTRSQHEPKRWPGQVLANAGAKAARIERWLRRDRGSAWIEAGRVLSITKGTPMDWAQFGFLLYAWDDPEVKRRFARDFFRAARRAGHTHANNEGDS
jgi:CRISPR type I-E-associated protein CasB/Cse2